MFPRLRVEVQRHGTIGISSKEAIGALLATQTKETPPPLISNKNNDQFISLSNPFYRVPLSISTTGVWRCKKLIDEVDLHALVPQDATPCITSIEATNTKSAGRTKRG